MATKPQKPARKPAKKTKLPAKTAGKTVSAAPKKVAKKKPATAKNKRGTQHVTRPTPEEATVIAERRELVLDLTTKGVSIRRIAEHLKKKGFAHHSPATVHADLTAALEERAKSRVKKTDLLVERELEKLDNWEFAISPLLEKDLSVYNNVDAKISVVNALIRLQNQRDKFEQISKPPEVKISASEALAKLLGRRPEEFPSNAASGDE